MGIDIRRNIYRPMQDMTFAAGKHLVLPLHNDAVTPTLAFGDGGDGLYSTTDGSLAFANNGVATWGVTATYLGTVVVDAPRLLKKIASNVVPTFIPRANDDNTGIGRAADDQLSLIAGGFEGLRIIEANGVANMDIVCHEGAVVTHNDNVVTLN